MEWMYGTYKIQEIMTVRVGEDFKEALSTAEDYISRYLRNFPSLLEPHAKLILCWNNRLRTSAGKCRIAYRELKQDGPHALLDLVIQIELNPKYLEEFGLERVQKTARHELAHAVDIMLNSRGTSHGQHWKKICKVLGGSMNPSQASTAGATACREYIRSEAKHCYTCPTCGREHWRAKRMSRVLMSKGYCRRCGTPVFQMSHHQT